MENINLKEILEAQDVVDAIDYNCIQTARKTLYGVRFMGKKFYCRNEKNNGKCAWNTKAGAVLAFKNSSIWWALLRKYYIEYNKTHEVMTYAQETTREKVCGDQLMKDLKDGGFVEFYKF